jgi:hypothetical protein
MFEFSAPSALRAATSPMQVIGEEYHLIVGLMTNAKVLPIDLRWGGGSEADGGALDASV